MNPLDPQKQQQLAPMMQQFQQALGNPNVMARLRDPAIRMKAAQHLASQAPPPPEEILAQLEQMSPPAQQQAQQAPASTLGGMMLPGGSPQAARDPTISHSLGYTSISNASDLIEEAKKEQDPVRRAELLRIARLKNNQGMEYNDEFKKSINPFEGLK